MADGTEKDSVVITSENNWTHTFGDLPKYDENDNHEIEYSRRRYTSGGKSISSDIHIRIQRFIP